MKFSNRRELSRPEVEPAQQELRNFLVTFLLACSFGPLGLRHFYLGNKRLGWIRTGLFAGGFVWAIAFIFMLQPAVAFMGIMATIVAVVWAIIDFFYVYFAVRTDNDGQALVMTQRDKKWARALFVAMIVLFAFSVILNVVTTSVGRNNLPANQFYTNNRY